MKRLCNRFCNFMQLYATLLFLAAAAAAQEPPSPEMAQEESGAAATSVPPVLLRDVKLQTIGEERFLEKLPPGLIFIDAATGKVMVADESNPHGRAVCTCRDIDWHSFTNTARFNGHRLEFNQFWSQVAEGGSLLYRFGTNSWLRLVGDTSGSLANLTVDSYDPTNGVMVITADATDGAVLQVCTNLMEAEAWKTATNATVTAATDAATTWSIAMLGTDVEFYRVLAEVQREAGIHAEKPIHANAGIEMGGERWDEWPTNHATEEWVEGYVATNHQSLAGLATTQELAAAFARAANDTCTLYWRSADLATNAIHAFDFPTDFPTPKLKIFAWTFGTTNAAFNLPSWNPGREVEIEFELGYASDRTTNNPTSLQLMGTTTISRTSAVGVYWLLRFSPESGRWITIGIVPVNGAGYQRNVAPDGSGATTGSGSIPEDAPATVAEWVALHPEWEETYVEQQARNTPLLSPALSPAISPGMTPLGPSVFQPIEELAFDGLAEEGVDGLGFEEPGEAAE